MKYAIVESGGKQYRAVEGETIDVDRLPIEAGASVKLEQVLLIADGENILVGTPLIKDNPVWTSALEHIKGPKVTTFNYHSKKRIRVKIGHRQNYTRLMVEQIGGLELVVKKAEAKKEKAKRAPQKAETKEVEAEVEAVEVKEEKKPAPKASAAQTVKKETKAAPAKSTKKETKPATKAAPKPAAKKTADKTAKPAPKTTTAKKTTKTSSSKTTKTPAKKAEK